MRKVACPLFLALVVIFYLAGCRTTGYDVKLESDMLISYSAVGRIESLLANKGFRVMYREKERYGADNPRDVSTFLIKHMGTDEHSNILIVLFYMKDETSENAHHFRIAIYNHFVGLKDPEIKDEIDALGDLIYRELSQVLREQNLKLNRKEWGPPAF